MNVEIFEEQARKDYAYFCLIADKIEADPSLLAKPLSNMERWLANGIWAGNMLDLWRKKIEDAQISKRGLDHLLAVLRDDGEDMRYFKGFSPFTGLLSKEERRQFV
jgi:hypothetical protein